MSFFMILDRVGDCSNPCDVSCHLCFNGEISLHFLSWTHNRKWEEISPKLGNPFLDSHYQNKGTHWMISPIIYLWVHRQQNKAYGGPNPSIPITNQGKPIGCEYTLKLNSLPLHWLSPYRSLQVLRMMNRCIYISFSSPPQQLALSSTVQCYWNEDGHLTTSCTMQDQWSWFLNNGESFQRAVTSLEAKESGFGGPVTWREERLGEWEIR